MPPRAERSGTWRPCAARTRSSRTRISARRWRCRSTAQTIAGVNPATRPGAQLVPDSLAGWSTDDNIPADVEQAKQILADAGYPERRGLPGAEDPVRRHATNVQLEALADTWQKNLGIKVALDMQEAGVYVERRWAVQEEDYIGFYFGTFGSTPTWSTWAANLWGPQFIQEFSLVSADWAEYQAIQANQDLDARRQDGPARRDSRDEVVRRGTRLHGGGRGGLHAARSGGPAGGAAGGGQDPAGDLPDHPDLLWRPVLRDQAGRRAAST